MLSERLGSRRASQRELEREIAVSDLASAQDHVDLELKDEEARVIHGPGSIHVRAIGQQRAGHGVALLLDLGQRQRDLGHLEAKVVGGQQGGQARAVLQTSACVLPTMQNAECGL